ncbi:MAG: hypothetical protein IT309_08530, partial [Anaerolineales bacterium]|nr:hypothetical protein [Anaerolineales bacterium]
SDELRKAISKKKKEDIDKHRAKFVKGAVEKGIEQSTADAIYTDWEEFARYGFNKCLPGDVEVLDSATGRLVKVEDLYRGAAEIKQTLSCDISTLKLKNQPVLNVMDNGMKPVFRLTTALGRTIEATGNHPFYTYNGWRNLEELQPDDFIAVPRVIPVEGKNEWADHEAIALGHLLAENPSKEIPANVFELTNRQIALLLEALWESAGVAADKSASYLSASQRTANQIQHLLLRFGILSQIREFNISSRKRGWQIVISDQESLDVFSNHILQSESLLATAPGGLKSSLSTWKSTEVDTLAQPEGVALSEPKRLPRTEQAALAPLNPRPAHDIYWDRIAYIEYVGEKQTYDLEIEETHNFVANDILVHNSHAADYGVIAVQTAYLKSHYPAEYMTALMSASAGQVEKVAFYIADARTMGVPVLQPDINSSMWDFDIEDTDAKPQIRFGLGAIKNVGQASVQPIIEERAANGKFSDLNDFARRVDLRSVGKRSLEGLIKVGALDSFGNRASLLASLDRIVAISGNHFRAADAGQMSLFGSTTGVIDEIKLPEVKDVDKREMLNWERELIGLYISDHPLNEYQATLAQIVSYFSAQLPDAAHQEKVRVAGIITNIRPYTTKAGKPMGFVTIEDIQGSVELLLFTRTWEQYRDQLAADQIIIVEGKVDQTNTPPKILADTIKTEIKVLEAAADSTLKPDSTPKPLLPRAESTSPRRPAPTPPKPDPQPEPIPTPTVGQVSNLPYVAESAPAYEPNDDAPPPPDNFPPGWDVEWQPSFDDAALAAKPAPKFKKDEAVTPPLAESAALSRIEALNQAEDREEPPIPSLYIPLAKENKDKDHPPQQITVLLRPTGDRDRDKRRIKTLYGTLISYHGR